MKKTIITIILILFALNTSYSQIKLSIDSLEISYVVDSSKVYFIGDSLVGTREGDKVFDLFDESLRHGPYIVTCITIENQSNDCVTLQWSDLYNNSYYEFNRNNCLYKVKGLAFQNFDEPIVIPKRGKYIISAGNWLFLESDIYKSSKFPGSEYNKEVIEVLPTLQFVLEYKGKIYKSCGIKKVIYVERNDYVINE